MFIGFIQSSMPRASPTIGGPSKASCKGQDRACFPDSVTINTLPDDVLLGIFDFFVKDWSTTASGWQTLAHVCQRWRDIVLASPRRLNLRLVYKGERPISEMPYVLSLLPVVIIPRLFDRPYRGPIPYSDLWVNTSAFLESEHRHRICEIDFSDIPDSQMRRLAAAMEQPFPQLTDLRIWAGYFQRFYLSDSFLGGSAPLLRHLELGRCWLPGIPKLLLSANHLVTLRVQNVPLSSGYISPQTWVTVLSVMDRLESFRLEPPYPPLDPGSRPSLTRSVLPALTELGFEGFHEYLEELLAQIEVPLLNKLVVTFFKDNFVVPQFHQLINHAESFNTCDRATVFLDFDSIQFAILKETDGSPELSLKMMFPESGHQFSSLAQLCSPSLLLPSTLVQLHIRDTDLSNPRSYSNGESTQCLEFLGLFNAIKDLYLTERAGRRVFQVLEELAEERVTEVLPALQSIFLPRSRSLKSAPKILKRFIAARQLSGHPVAVYPWQSVSVEL
ncbi:hypothetical protein F5148DRAFT_368357 [Russula earlei]|uniref:Uncharacterized protein n=1 Tax=Russula earlei TaxID=71964 RepID=A0ACC0U1V5_9AGAM|nr:hypothetical protein F5148DRAFT_368357 [Russula earlei]